MSKDPSDSRMPDDPKSNDLIFGNAADFEKNLQDGIQTTEDLNLAKDTMEAIEGYYFKVRLKEIHKRLFRDSVNQD